MGCFSPDQPSQTNRNYNSEMTDTLNTQIGLAPRLYGAESAYQPRYTQLALGNLGISLAGNAGAASGGLAGLYSSLYPSMVSATRTGNTQDMARLGPQVVAAMNGMDPAGADLLNQLTSQTGTELGMGGNLDPSLMRLATQGVRARQAGMLGGTGNAGDYGEALGLSQFGQQLKQQRQGNASNVVQLRNQIYGGALNTAMTQGTGTAGAAFGMAPGISAGAGPSLYNPQSQYAGDLYGSNAQYAAMFADPSTMAKLGMIQNHIGNDVKIAGSVAGMAGV